MTAAISTMFWEPEHTEGEPGETEVGETEAVETTQAGHETEATTEAAKPEPETAAANEPPQEEPQPEPAPEVAPAGAPAPAEPIPDTDEDEFNEVPPAEFEGKLYYAWVLVSVTFIALVLPLGFFLLPYTPAAIAHRTSSTPWRTVAQEEATEEQPEEEKVPEKCDSQLVIDETEALPSPTFSGFNVAPARHHRVIICVFDPKYHRETHTYMPDNIPTPLCNFLVYYSVAVSAYGFALRRPELDPQYLGLIKDLKTSPAVIQQTKVPLLMTIGGELSDSQNISRALKADYSRRTLATWLVELVKRFDLQGINLHWSYPLAKCGHKHDKQNLQEFMTIIKSYKSVGLLDPNFHVALTIPPRADYVERYGMNTYHNELDFIIVTTHTLQSGRRVECKGRGIESARIARAVMALVPHGAARKVAVSISLGVNTFVAEEPHIGSASTKGAPIDPTSKHPRKAGYHSVCNLPRSQWVETGEDECSMTFSLAGPNVYYVATFMTEENIRIRMRRSYERGVGDSPVVVYDMDLDDFMGTCSASGYTSTLMNAILHT
ncbi:uncharacterized protein LOC135393352 [Ornithodoros turicata]|uniref:uncharacterized protein LOC135393352 n=1 Tax=Ornithodoros turicata TaxID=34597 RepID=UPI003139BCFF